MNKKIVKIEDNQQYLKYTKILAKQKSPAKVLCLLMNAVESYRQARKLGWSRSWNKVNLNNFQSFKLKMAEETQWIDLANQLIKTPDLAMPKEAQNFCQQLLSSKKLMGFIFYHEFLDQGQKFEGVTLSFGQIKNKRYRDRFDIILESPIQKECSLGLQRLRLFVDPWRDNNKQLLWQTTVSCQQWESAKTLFILLAKLSWQWANHPEHQWQHWTVAYIDYFSPRQWQQKNSYFYLPNRPQDQLTLMA